MSLPVCAYTLHAPPQVITSSSVKRHLRQSFVCLQIDSRQNRSAGPAGDPIHFDLSI